MMRHQLSDVIIEHAQKTLDTQTKMVLYGAAYSLKETEGKEAEKGKVFKGARDPEALACFFFDLLLMHNPSFCLREALLSIAEELNSAPTCCSGYGVEKYIYESGRRTPKDRQTARRL